MHGNPVIEVEIQISDQKIVAIRHENEAVGVPLKIRSEHIASYTLEVIVNLS